MKLFQKTIIAYTLLSLNLFCKEVIELKVSRIIPGSNQQSQLIKAFELYNKNIENENVLRSENYNESRNKAVRKQVIDLMYKEKNCRIKREILPRPDAGCLYIVEILGHNRDSRGNFTRNFIDQDAYFKFPKGVDLATDSTYFFDAKDTGRLLTDSFGRKYKLFEVLDFGSEEKIFSVLADKFEIDFPPPPQALRKLTRQEYIQKLKAVGTITTIGQGRDIECPKCKGGTSLNPGSICTKCNGNNTIPSIIKYIVTW